MKRKNVWAAIALTMMATVVAGCSKDDSNADNSSIEPQPEPVVTPVELPTSMELTRAELEMVNSSNEFAFNLFRTAQDEKESQILSPISITYALGMLNNGAAGETQQQIDKVLGFSDAAAKRTPWRATLSLMRSIFISLRFCHTDSMSMLSLQ